MVNADGHGLRMSSTFGFSGCDCSRKVFLLISVNDYCANNRPELVELFEFLCKTGSSVPLRDKFEVDVRFASLENDRSRGVL